MKVEGVAGVEQFASPGKGRGLRASRAFGVGELLLSCPAYSYVLSVKERGLICEQCFSRKTGLARCGKCKKAFYCNVNCQKKNWSMHKLECQAMCAFGQHWCPSETVRLVARIIARLRDQRERSPSENLLLLRDMEDHLEDLDNEKRQMIEAHIASLHQFYSKHLDFPEHQALLTLFSQVHCNGFTVEDEELSNLGLAIFPDIALLNHSCSPNVIVTYRGINAEVRAVQSISAGQEIFTSYIDLLYPCEDRMERLRDMYYFNCDCKVCTMRSTDMEKMSVRKLRDEIGEKEIRDMVRYARNAMEDFRRAKHEKSPAALLEMCELSIDKMSSVFEDSNVYILHMMYQAMGICLFTENYDGAVRYGEKLLQPFTVLYPEYSLNVASVYLKMARLYVAVGRKSAGITAFQKALAVMEIVHGKDHTYVTELKQEMAVK